MISTRLKRLVSMLLASVAAVVPMSQMPGVATTAAMAQEATSFANVDVTTMSAGQLTQLVSATVSELPAGLSDAEIAAAVGRALAPATIGLSEDEITALLRNVAFILDDLGIEASSINGLILLLHDGVEEAGGTVALNGSTFNDFDAADSGPGGLLLGLVY